MNKPVGYLFNHPEGLAGERGLYYDYIIGSNGIYIEAENALMATRIPVAECEIRGLAPVESKLSLTYGSIPQRFFDLALNLFLSDLSTEHYVAVVGDAGYRFHIPIQDKSSGGVVYEARTSVALEMHSHGKMRAFFSPGDNKDETGLKLYGVIGRLDATPIVKLRVGVYGYFKELFWSEVFDGSLIGALEYEEEVITEGDLQNLSEPNGHGIEHPGRRLWWNWKLRR